jgi:hypothetical protein
MDLVNKISNENYNYAQMLYSGNNTVNNINSVNPSISINNAEEEQKEVAAASTTDTVKISSAANQYSVANQTDLSEEEQKTVEELKKVNDNVEKHEDAHQAVAGDLFKGKSITYKSGPDGKQYAVAGEVQIDTTAESDDPQATMQKMERVRSAALAPSDPSAQDQKVASEASQAIMDAQAQMQQGANTQNKTGNTTEQAQNESKNPSAAPSNEAYSVAGSLMSSRIIQTIYPNVSIGRKVNAVA